VIDSQADLSLTNLAFSQDGHWLALGSSDGKVRLWDLNAPDPAASAVDLPGHPGSITALTFEPSGRWLFTAGADGTVKRWRLRREDLVDLACRTAGRNLTPDEWEQYLGGEPNRKTCPDFP
jgi:WD40 repeat protein